MPELTTHEAGATAGLISLKEYMKTEMLILDENQVAYSNGYIQALKDVCNIMNDCEWPEDLEMELYDFMKEKGMKV